MYLTDDDKYLPHVVEITISNYCHLETMSTRIQPKVSVDVHRDQSH